METNTDKERRSVRTMLADGALAEWYSRQYFCKIVPNFEIDKVKVTFVKLGTQGAHLDIYVDTDVFTYFCEEVYRGTAFRKLDAGLPIFRYATGENGADKLTIQKGNVGIVIQGRAKLITGHGSAKTIGKYETASVVISKTATLINDKAIDQTVRQQATVESGKGALFAMAQLYLMVSGLNHVDGYYAQLNKVYWDSAAKQNVYHHEYTANQQNNTVQTTQSPRREAPAEQRVNQPQQPAKMPANGKLAETVQKEYKGSYKLSHQFLKDGSFYCGKVKSSDGREAYIYVPDSVMNALSESRRATLSHLPVGSDLAFTFVSPFDPGTGPKGLKVTGFAV